MKNMQNVLKKGVKNAKRLDFWFLLKKFKKYLIWYRTILIFARENKLYLINIY